MDAGFCPVGRCLFRAFSDLAAGRSPELAIVIGGKLLVAAVLVLPLALAMGATLPALAFAAERLDPAHGVQRVSRYYVVNATGAAFGAALAGFVLIDQLGLELPLTLGAAVNLAIMRHRVARRARRNQPDNNRNRRANPNRDSRNSRNKPNRRGSQSRRPPHAAVRRHHNRLCGIAV